MGIKRVYQIKCWIRMVAGILIKAVGVFAISSILTLIIIKPVLTLPTVAKNADIWITKTAGVSYKQQLSSGG